MDKCLADVINDPQALKEFLRSNSQADISIGEFSKNADISSSTSLDEALSSSLDFLASITTSSNATGTEYGIGDTHQGGLDSVQDLFNQIPSYNVTDTGLNTSLNSSSITSLQNNTVPSEGYGSTFQNVHVTQVGQIGLGVTQSADAASFSGPAVQDVYTGNALFSHGQNGNVGLSSGKSPSPGVHGSVQIVASPSASLSQGRNSPMGQRARSGTSTAGKTISSRNINSRSPVQLGQKGAPINLDPTGQQVEGSDFSNVLQGAQQAILNNGITSSSGQAILLPSTGGKMLIVNSPAKGNQAIAIAAGTDFLQQPTSYLTNATPNAGLAGKQLFVLPSQLQNTDLTKQTHIVGMSPQNISSLSNNGAVQQLNINYANIAQVKPGQFANVVTKSEGQPSIAVSAAVAGSQGELQPRPPNVNVLVPSQPRGILPKRVNPTGSSGQHPNILPKVTGNQTGTTMQAFSGASKQSGTKSRMTQFTSGTKQGKQQLATGAGGVQFIASHVNPNHTFVSNAQLAMNTTNLSILQSSARTTSPLNPSSLSSIQGSSPVISSVTLNSNPNQIGNRRTPNETYTLVSMGQNVALPNSAISLGGSVQPSSGSSPLTHVQSSSANQRGTLFNLQATGNIPTLNAAATQGVGTVGTSSVFQQGGLLQQSQPSAVVLNTSTVSTPGLAQMSLVPGQLLQSGTATQLTSGLVPQMQGQTQVPGQTVQSPQQPQYSLLGKEGIQKLIQLYQQQGQATGQKLTSLGSLGAANLTALMQKLMFLQQQQQQQQQQTMLQPQVQVTSHNNIATQQLHSATSTPVQLMTPQNARVISAQSSTAQNNRVMATPSIQGNPPNSLPASNVKLTRPPGQANAGLNTEPIQLSNLLVSANKDVSTGKPFLLSSTQPATKVQASNSTVQNQSIQLVTNSPIPKLGENKPLLVQLPSDKGAALTSFLSTGQLTQSQLQDLQQKLLAQKINQQAQSLLPKQMASSAQGQATPNVNTSSLSGSGTTPMKANVVYIKPTARQQKVGGPTSLAMSTANIIKPGTITTSQTNTNVSKIVIKSLATTATSVMGPSNVISKSASIAGIQQKVGVPKASSVGEIQTSPQGHQKIIISKKIKDQLQSLSPAQKEQLLRNPKQVLVINGQKVPLAQLLQQLAEEAKVVPKGGKAAAKRPFSSKDAEEKKVEESESKIAKRLKHCLAADQARVLKPERDKAFRSAEDALSKLIPYHVCFEETPDGNHYRKDEVLFESVAQQLIDKKENIIRRFEDLLFNEYQRSVSTAELVMLSRLFVTDEKAHLQKEREDAKEGKFQLNFLQQTESEDESEGEVSDNLLCGEEMEEDEVVSDKEDSMEETLGDHDDFAMKIDSSVALDTTLDVTMPNIAIDSDMTQELNEATSNLLADLESEDMFSL